MAITGLIWVGFVILHVAGNLQAFGGREKLNAYSAMLHGPAAEVLWLIRAILVLALALHVWSALSLARASRSARPVGYRMRNPQVSTAASRSMRIGGLLILAFIIFHILHFTTGNVDPGGWAGRVDAGGRYDIYGNIVSSFRIWWVTAIYLASMVLLGLHLWHGVWSSPRSLGVARSSPTPLRRRVAPLLAVLLWLGFSIVPIAVIAGVIR